MLQTRPRFALCCLALAGLFLLLPAAGAHDENTVHRRPARVLGTIDFPTSAKSPAAQQAFIRGALLLHLFEYDFARDEFAEAQRIEPAFAMAYWGEAMTYTHPIWDEQDAAKARASLARLAPTAEQRAARAPTPREKAFLASLEALYGKGSKAERDRSYEFALADMARQFPDDREVQLFHALALMGTHAGVRDVPAYMQAAAIAQAVFCANPDHPGAAHYLIHAVDDPDHAVLGLQAARALERMAPDASHSLHMASHIFVALGMWDDVVRANESATAVRNRMNAEHGQGPSSSGHQNFWLLYGYLQQGRHARARELLDAARKQLQTSPKPPPDPLELDPDVSQIGSVVQMWARYLIETGDWSGEVADWKFDPHGAFDPRLTLLYIESLRSARTGKADAAAQALERFRSLRDELTTRLRALPENKPGNVLYLKRLDVLEHELQAQVARARGDLATAIDQAREASRLEGEMPVSFGPPFVDAPAAEMVGALLAEKHDDAAALAAFDLQLTRSKSRPASLLGKAAAETALGHAAAAARARAEVRSIWRAADPAVASRIADAAGETR